VRNAFAHDIRNLNISLIELIKKKKQDINLLGHLSLLKAATDKMIATREKEPNLLKLEIILSTLRFLNFAYDAAVK
jgi:hypothetical protein